MIYRRNKVPRACRQSWPGAPASCSFQKWPALPIHSWFGFDSSGLSHGPHLAWSRPTIRAMACCSPHQRSRWIGTCNEWVYLSFDREWLAERFGKRLGRPSQACQWASSDSSQTSWSQPVDCSSEMDSRLTGHYKGGACQKNKSTKRVRVDCQ